MEDIILKLKMLKIYFPSIKEWYNEVWKQDPHVRECCDGYMCGCYGATYYDHWKWAVSRKHFKE